MTESKYKSKGVPTLEITDELSKAVSDMGFIPCNLIGSNWCDLFTNSPFFTLNRIFSPANEEATLKTKQPIRLQGLFKVTDHIAGR